MGIHTYAIEERLMRGMMTPYFEGPTKKPPICILSTGAGLMMAVADMLSDRHSPYVMDLSGPLFKRVSMINLFSSMETPSILLLWLSLMPASKYLPEMTKGKNSWIYPKGLIDCCPKSFSHLGHVLIADLSDFESQSFDQCGYDTSFHRCTATVQP